VLRHDLRNDVNVILGRLEVLDREADLPPEAAEQVATISDVAERMIALAERARYIDRTLSTFEGATVEVTEGLERAAVGVAGESLTVEIDDAPEPPCPVAAPVDVIVGELLTVVATNHDEPEVSIRADHDPRRGTVTVELESDEPLLPETARNAIVEDLEHSHRHSIGLDMWAIRWLLEASGGSLGYDDADGTVTVSLPAVPAGEDA